MKYTYKIIKPLVISENLMNNKEIIKQFMELYRTQIPSDFKELKKAVNNKDFEKISSCTHHIKPTMVYIGANLLKDKLENLELLVKGNNTIATINKCFTSIESEYQLLLDEINIYLSSIN